MKKLGIFVLLVVLLLIALPFIGNKLVEATLDDRVEVLTSYGLRVKETMTQSSYLSTKKHFVFEVEDKVKFVGYLQQFSDAQLPSYIDALLDGAEVGFDISYRNIPTSDFVGIDIYPYALPSVIIADMKKQDADFYSFVEKLLKTKAILYHLNYNILNNGFDGYIQNIDESYTLKNDLKLVLKIVDAEFSGKGMLIAPDSFFSTMKTFQASASNKDEYMNIDLSGLSSTSVFESKTSYSTTIKLKNINWSAKSLDVPLVSVEMKNLALDFSSNTQSVKADFYAKSSFDSLKLNTVDVAITADKFNYDLALREVDKDVYESITSVISQAKASATPDLELKMQELMLELFARGMVLDIADFSIQELSTLNTKNLGGMKFKAKLIFKEDKDLAKKLKSNPIALINSMDLDLLFVMSKVMYARLSQVSPMFGMVKGFAKNVNDDIVFEVKLQDSQVSVNGREIR